MKIITLIISSFLVFSFLSCEKQLEIKPISSLSVDNFYNSVSDFEQSINGAYSSLKNYPLWLLRLSETRSDNLYAVMDGARDFEPINHFKSSISSLGFIKSVWSDIYTGIMRTNTTLEQLDNGVITDNAMKDRMEGELKFLRGLYHFTLLKFFGGVPVITTTLDAQQALDVPRSSVSEVYEAVISDFETAISLLPENAALTGKATKDAARGLLADVYLTRSGPKHGIEGAGQETNEYNKVIELVNQITARTWVADYASVFSYTNENNPDILFDVQLVNQIGLGNSYPGDLLSEGYFRSIAAANLSGKPQNVQVSNDLFNSYDPSDVRRNFIIQEGYTESGNFVDIRIMVKFVDAAKVPVNADWGINFPVMRYTDVLMMKAEAIIKGGTPGTQNDADEIVNQVRARAGLDPLVSVTFEQLMEERRKEFAGEGLRWFDLARTPDIVEKMNTWIAAEDVFGLIDEVIPNYIIYPIPANEIDVKKGLYTQNPGY
ncbi:MAG: RagB/SusD family nutrient uptake outer membrane protein [Flavitalea sp.]